jgi:enoyl-CoA hydratase/carnithine racemase
MSDDLLYTVKDHIGHIILNRRHRHNALTFDMYKRIGEICATVGTKKDRDQVKVLILSGSGDAAFAAGTDISQFHDFKGAPDGLEYEKNMEAMLGQIETCNVPTIAALNGFVTGGGAGIAASCSIRIGSEDLKVGVPIARTLGNCLAIGTLRRFVALVGFARTRYILLTAHLIDGHEASTAGFINELLADKTAVTERAFELAASISNFAPLTLKASMTSLNRLEAATAMPNDDDIIAMCYGSDDFKEGMSAFFEKRKPNWQGK